MAAFLLMFAALTAAAPSRVSAAQLEGVTLPDTTTVAGTTLLLNGIALRTYSIFNVSIYVAGLYLPTRMRDAAAIAALDKPKMLVFHFMHDVDIDAARKSWQEGFDDNCAQPCNVRQDLIRQFIAGVVPVTKGDVSKVVFQGPHVSILMNDRQIGDINDRNFAYLIMDSFIGVHPPTSRVKQELLGER